MGVKNHGKEFRKLQSDQAVHQAGGAGSPSAGHGCSPYHSQQNNHTYYWKIGCGHTGKTQNAKKKGLSKSAQAEIKKQYELQGNYTIQRR